MKRIAAVFVMTVAVSALSVVPAQAAPQLCLSLDLELNGQGQAQTICLPS